MIKRQEPRVREKEEKCAYANGSKEFLLERENPNLYEVEKQVWQNAKKRKQPKKKKCLAVAVVLREENVIVCCCPESVYVRVSVCAAAGVSKASQPAIIIIITVIVSSKAGAVTQHRAKKLSVRGFSLRLFFFSVRVSFIAYCALSWWCFQSASRKKNIIASRHNQFSFWTAARLGRRWIRGWTAGPVSFV